MDRFDPDETHITNEADIVIETDYSFLTKEDHPLNVINNIQQLKKSKSIF